MLQSVRVSVGRTWRLARPSGESDTAWDDTAYVRRLRELNTPGESESFRLPWPVYPSTLWAHLCGPSYRTRRASVLRDAMVPFFRELLLTGTDPRRPIPSEVMLHPFAATTVVHMEIDAVEPWPTDPDASALLNAVLRRPLPTAAHPDRRLADGLTIEDVGGRPTAAFGGIPAAYDDVGRFMFWSGLHQESADPGALAYRLASLFEKSATDRSRPMNTDGSAISVTGRSVAFVLPRAQTSAGERVRCLHRNMTTLLAYAQNLLTLVSGSGAVGVSPACRPFQARAAAMLNALYRNTPLPGADDIYKSRLAELWIGHLGREAAIDAVNARFSSGLPTLAAQ